MAFTSSWGTPRRRSQPTAPTRRSQPTAPTRRSQPTAPRRPAQVDLDAFLLDPLPPEGRAARWETLAALADDTADRRYSTTDRLYETVVGRAAQLGFDQVCAVHADHSVLDYAGDRRTPAAADALKGLDRRAAAVLIVRAELAARMLGARTHGSDQYVDDGSRQVSIIDHPRVGTEPVRDEHRGTRDRMPPPSWFVGWKPGQIPPR